MRFKKFKRNVFGTVRTRIAANLPLKQFGHQGLTLESLN